MHFPLHAQEMGENSWIKTNIFLKTKDSFHLFIIILEIINTFKGKYIHLNEDAKEIINKV